MILLIDNYDSFSHNLYQYVGEIEPEIVVVRNDELTVQEIANLKPDRIVISPGPGRPEDAGVSIDVVRELGERIPILGVCLGHQAICAAFGAVVTHAKSLMHGKASTATLKETCPIFKGCPQRASVARYHSLAVDPDTLPECLETVSFVPDGEVMAVQHRRFHVFGLQFHPESILTSCGKTILRNFIKEI